MASSPGSTVSPQDYSMSGDAPAVAHPRHLGDHRPPDLQSQLGSHHPRLDHHHGHHVQPVVRAGQLHGDPGTVHAVTVPAGASATLSELGVAPVDRPMVTMVDTGADQDACQNVRLTLHYQGEAIG